MSAHQTEEGGGGERHTLAVAGQIIEGGTRLVRILGRGTHSVVYLAVTERGAPRAVKIFPPHLADFAEREYRHALGLTHPTLAPVLGRTLIGAQPALIAAYARGEVFLTRYRQRPALARERPAFVRTLTHVLEALAYLHRRGLLHRDVKPDNILVEEDGSAKLVDYDLSGTFAESRDAPVHIGTPAFQSPEARRGEPLGPGSDLYSVGVLLHWGLCGELPDPESPPPPSADPLAELLPGLLHPDLPQRPSDAAQVAESLRRLAPLEPR